MGKYFGGFTEDWAELTGKNTSGSTKVLAGLKIVGKAVANVGKFTVSEILPETIVSNGKRAEEVLAKNRKELTKEQIDEAEKIARRGQDVGKRLDEARRVQWEIDRKYHELAQEMERCPTGNPATVRLRKEIAQLETKQPKWYENKTEKRTK